MKRYKETWFRGYNESSKETLKNSLKQSEFVLDRLASIIKDKAKDSKDAQKLVRNYEDPNWALKQADYIGEQRAYQEILNLITPTS